MVAKERLNYFQGQFLGAEDFKAEQAYHRDMRRRHNLAHHTWGIVTGLELVQRETEGGEGVDVYIQPGMATDGYGREIVVFEPHKLSAADFAGFDTSGFKKIYIAYDEEQARRPPFGFANCEEGNRFARVRETFRIVIEPKESAVRDGVTVAGKLVPPPPYADPPPDLTIPADESVPYQELPDDETDPHWAVRLGSVEWDFDKQIFLKAETEAGKAKLTEGRVYVGVVAEQLLAPASTLRLRPRTTPLLSDGKPAGPDDLPFASVEGRLRVEGRIVAKKDVHIHGGQLSFKTVGGGDENIPLWMQRRQNDGAPGFNLRVHIGDAADKAEGAKARLSVGPLDGTKEKTVFGVRGDDRVEIPTGSLDFGEKTRQMLNLWKEEYGIGVQSGTLYFRTAADFCWFRGGVHEPGNSQPGGGKLAMKLDNSGNRLVVHNSVRARHVDGKVVDGDALDNLYLNWETGRDVVVGNPSGVKSDLVVSGDLTVHDDLVVNDDAVIAGDLVVSGNASSVFHAHKETRALKVLAPPDVPRAWSIFYNGVFKEVYTAFVVLQGYSLWDYENNTDFAPDPGHHALGGSVIPQHVFVRLDNFDKDSANGVCYCSESDPNFETDNTVLFTLVVLGRK